MADMVVSATMGVMKPLLDKLAKLMGEEYKKLKGLRKEVTFLQRELSDMDALLEKMDLADELDPQAKNWRRDIIEMSYDIEDRIDDFMNCIGEAEDKTGILQRASRYLRTFKDRRRLANEFQEIKSRVMEASERRKRHMLDQCISITIPVTVDPRISVLYKESASLVGIETQKEELVKWVMDKRQELKVMAIVGLGGLGKTTLANEVYREVGGQFDCMAFVSVSQKPEMIGLFNSLLKQLGLPTCSHACHVQDPINDLRRCLRDKRYFIVVDDMWDTCAWNTICCAFPQNSQHSRIVITTRIQGVARACCGSYGFIHTMNPLSEADSRKLFFDRIFGSEDACPSELANSSTEILKKCGGLPLAIITMASTLASQPTRLEGQWEYIQNSLATKFATNTNYEDMMYILDLSYKNLPRCLKACFLYLGSYPEDHQIKRVDLVRRWVAEGFVNNSNGQDVWDVADSYFNELVNRSMVQPTYKDYTIGIFGCRVHDMLLELIMRRCEEDNFLSLVNEPQAAVEVQDKVIRRLTVVDLRGAEDGEVATTSIWNLSQIRSLTILRGSYWIPSLLEFKFVRVLFIENSLGHHMEMDMTCISQLSQLRYVEVQECSQGRVLPCQIHGLRLLETLDLSSKFGCAITLDIIDAPRLSHLIVPHNTRLPCWIGQLKGLRTVNGFSLPVDSLESIVGLGELIALSNLCLQFPEGCSPFLESTWMSTLSTSLEKLSNLRQLDLVAAMTFQGIAWCADGLISLSPPFCNLERLVMNGCTFSRVPRWISHLQNLRLLCLGMKQIIQEDIAMIGTRLPFLIELGLRVSGTPMENIMIGGSMGFQLLKTFRFDSDGISGLRFKDGAMPKLQVLELIFNVDVWDFATPGGLQHLPSLKKIVARRLMCDDVMVYEEPYGELIRGVFEEAARALPTRPTIISGEEWLPRPIEEEYLKVNQGGFTNHKHVGEMPIEEGDYL